MKSLMIDLDTCGTTADAPILSVGAVFFSVSQKKLGQTFYKSVDPASAFAFGKADGDTFRWWMGQEDGARKAVVCGHEPLDAVLKAFEQFVAENATNPAQVEVWSKGTSFDETILNRAYARVLKKKAPWPFWGVRCVRTVEALAGTRVPAHAPKGILHNALDDAVYQAERMIALIPLITGGHAEPLLVADPATAPWPVREAVSQMSPVDDGDL